MGEIMQLPGEAYLFTLSLVAATFAVVSALVMIMRQSMGGKMSLFDVYLITTYISWGFTQSLIALLPPLVALFEPTPRILWAASSGVSAVVFAAVLFSIVHRRLKASPEPIALAVKTSFSMHGVTIAIFLVNAIAEPWQGVHLFATGLTLSVAAVMWAFVRRIASLFGVKPSKDWDPKRG
jgi:hypothetical protein